MKVSICSQFIKCCLHSPSTFAVIRNAAFVLCPLKLQSTPLARFCHGDEYVGREAGALTIVVFSVLSFPTDPITRHETILLCASFIAHGCRRGSSHDGGDGNDYG